MNKKVSLIGILVILAGCILLAITGPLEARLGSQGQWALIGIILTLGIWIFKPFGLPFSANVIKLR